MLIVDDEIEFIKALMSYFELLDFDIYSAVGGETAIEIAEEKKPDIILLDLKMPRLGGDEIINRMRQVSPCAKIIMITAYDDGEKTKEYIMKIGVDGYFDKPISSLVHLEEHINKLLGH